MPPDLICVLQWPQRRDRLEWAESTGRRPGAQSQGRTCWAVAVCVLLPLASLSG